MRLHFFCQHTEHNKHATCSLSLTVKLLLLLLYYLTIGIDWFKLFYWYR